MQFVARLSSDGNRSRLHLVLQLPVTPALPDKLPAIVSRQSKDLSDFHELP